jgi:hypothetical protein
MLHGRGGPVVRGGLDRTKGIRRSYREQLAAVRVTAEPLALPSAGPVAALERDREDRHHPRTTRLRSTATRLLVPTP